MRPVRHVAAALGCAGIAAASTLTAAPAHAVLPEAVTVSSPSCGTVTIKSTTAAKDSLDDLSFTLDEKLEQSIARVGQTRTWTQLPSGIHYWTVFDHGHARNTGWVSVKPCSSTWPKMRVAGDLSGDGKADVLAIKTDGNLYYYRTTATGLAPGVKVGHGWGTTIDAARDSGPGDATDILRTRRSDGTVWQYTVGANGVVTGGKQVGTVKGFGPVTTAWMSGVKNGKMTDFSGEEWEQAPSTLTQAKKLIAVPYFGRPLTHGDMSALLGITPDGSMTAHRMDMYDFATGWEMVAWTDPAKPVSTGWQTYGLVGAPGSLDGDAYTDLIARKDDGNLYRYTNGRGYWKSGVKIGANWQSIKHVF